MFAAQAEMKDQSYKVKNTFLEIPSDEGSAHGKRRTRSDCSMVHPKTSSPLVLASRSPTGSPQLHPVDETMQAVPIDEVNFELLEEAVDPSSDLDPNASTFVSARGSREEPAYVVPTTPSPFLHSAAPPSMVPPLGVEYGGMYGLPDAALPPAFGVDGGCAYAEDGSPLLGYMEGMPFMPSYGNYMQGYGGWAHMQMDASGFTGPGAEDVMQLQDGTQQGQLQMRGGAGAENAKEGSGRRKKRQETGESRASNEGGADMAKPKKDGESKADRRAAIQAAALPGEGGKGSGKQSKGNDGDGSSAMAAPVERTGNEEPVDVDYTTVMLRNIPNKYTREMLIKQLNVEFGGHYDFMYLPIDFKNKCNVGYCFINFRTSAVCGRFVAAFNGVDVRKCLPGLNSKKIVEVTPARVQGRDENVRRLRNSPVMNQLADHPEWMPLIFSDSGMSEEFPAPDQPLSPVKPRGKNRAAYNE